MNYREQFDKIYASLKETEMYDAMLRTVEGSPWHREANVAVHTDMVVAEYCRLVDLNGRDEWTRQDLIGGVACAFHDVGKPQAEVHKWSEERGNYRAYGGHELLSARMAEDFLLTHNLLEPEQVTAVVWIIEHHMPWNIDDASKLKELATTADYYGFETYTTALLADQYGRIADDQAAKNARAEDWVGMLSGIDRCSVTKSDRVAWMAIGASGSGKSTFLKELNATYGDIAVFSLDQLRHEFYHPTDYAKAFEMSTKAKDFESRTQGYLFKMLNKEPNYVYIDNTNTSSKRRRRHVELLRKRGYEVRAVVFPVALQTVIHRQTTRGDKSVPKDAVIRQYMSLQQPMLGEFDAIVVCRSQ